MSDDDTRSTFKHLTLENWLQPDGIARAFGEVNVATGEVRAASSERWAERFLAVELSAGVPPEVRDMWAIARGILLYGWYFYPLYAVGDGQLHRVADAAVRHRYEQANGPRDGRTGQWPTLKPRLDWLIAQGIIGADYAHQWDAVRELRNEGAHADFAHIAMPMDALRSLDILARLIDGLYEGP